MTTPHTTTFRASRERPNSLSPNCTPRFLWLALALLATALHASAAPVLPTRGNVQEFDTVVQLLATSPQQITTTYVCKGISAINDGAGGRFYYLAGDTTATNSTDCFVWSAGRLRRNVDAITATRISVSGGGSNYVDKLDLAGIIKDARNEGALMNGVSDDSVAVQSALNKLSALGGGELVFPSGTCVLNSDITIPNNVAISGVGGTILNFASATITTGCLLATGSIAALPSVSGTATNHSLTVAFASAPSVVAGDTVLFYNTDDYSFNPYRAEYRDGEFCRVASILGANVTFTAPLFSSYTNGTVAVYKMTPVTTRIRNMKIIGKNGSTKPVIKLSLAQNCTLQDLVITGSEHTQIWVDRCYSSSIGNVYCYDTSANVGYNYGILVGNSQRITIANAICESTRHGLSFGGGDYAGAVPNRDCSIIGGLFASAGQVYGLNFHGNSINCNVVGASLPNGVEVASGIQVQNCRISNSNVNGYAFTDNAESNSADTLLSGNHIFASRLFNEALVTFTSYTNTLAGSVCRYLNNWVEAGLFTRSDYPTTKTTVMRFLIAQGGQSDIKFEASGNTVVTTCAIAGEYNGIDAYVPYATNSLSYFTAFGNTLQNCGIKWNSSVQNVFVARNKVFDALGDGINGGNVVGGTLTKAVIDISNNDVQRADHTGIKVIPDTLAYVSVRDNVALQNALTVQGSTLDSQCYVGQGALSIVEGNIFGDTSGTTTNYLYALGSTVSVHRNNTKIGLSNTFVGSAAANNIGTPSNTIIYTDSSYGYRGDTRLFWDATAKTLCIGSQSAGVANYAIRAVENIAADTHWMQIVNGGAGGASGVLVNSIDTSGYMRVYPTTWAGLAAQVGRTALQVNTGTGLYLGAETAGQTIDFYTSFGKLFSLTDNAAEFTNALKADQNATAGETRMLLWDIDAGALKRVSIGAIDSGGAGYKVLRVPN